MLLKGTARYLTEGQVWRFGRNGIDRRIEQYKFVPIFALGSDYILFPLSSCALVSIGEILFQIKNVFDAFSPTLIREIIGHRGAFPS